MYNKKREIPNKHRIILEYICGPDTIKKYYEKHSLHNKVNTLLYFTHLHIKDTADTITLVFIVFNVLPCVIFKAINSLYLVNIDDSDGSSITIE